EPGLEGNRCQIQLFRRETVRVPKELPSHTIPFVLTKGMAFESTLYESLRTTYMNDIDFMIAPRDRAPVMLVRHERGFRPFVEWATAARREVISCKLHRDHPRKLAREIDAPGNRMISVDVANSRSGTVGPFDAPVGEALESPVGE